MTPFSFCHNARTIERRRVPNLGDPAVSALAEPSAARSAPCWAESLCIERCAHMTRAVAPTLLVRQSDASQAQAAVVVCSMLAVPFIVMLSATKRRHDCPNADLLTAPLNVMPA